MHDGRFGLALRCTGHAGVRALLALAWCAVATLALAQSTPPPDPLGTVGSLVGRWSGETEGEPGKGTVEREYEHILNGRFVQVRNRSTYPPQPKNSKGEVHEDIGIFSLDKARKASLPDGAVERPTS